MFGKPTGNGLDGSDMAGGLTCRWIHSVDLREVSQEGRQCQETAHYTLVCLFESQFICQLLRARNIRTITKESKISSCYYGNSNIELEAAKAVKLLHIGCTMF
jgi:hypothetical protein